MPSKRVDERIRELLASGLRSRQRSLIVLVGDRGREQAVTLHALLHKLALELPLPTASGAGAAAPTRPRASTLWCYQRDLGFSTHRNKRAVSIRDRCGCGCIENSISRCDCSSYNRSRPVTAASVAAEAAFAKAGVSRDNFDWKSRNSNCLLAFAATDFI